MAPFASIDLQSRCAGRADAGGIVVSLLISFDDGERQAAVQRIDAFYQQRGFTGAGTGYQIEIEDTVSGKLAAIFFGVAVSLRKNIALDFHHAGLT